MTARHRQIASAMATALNGGSFIQSFTATAKSIQLSDLPDVQSLTVTVVPRSRISRRVARRIWQDHYAIPVAVQAAALHTDQDALDSLELLVEEITDFLDEAGRMAGAAQEPETQLERLFHSERLVEGNLQFLAVPLFTYRLEREI